MTCLKRWARPSLLIYVPSISTQEVTGRTISARSSSWVGSQSAAASTLIPGGRSAGRSASRAIIPVDPASCHRFRERHRTLFVRQQGRAEGVGSIQDEGQLHAIESGGLDSVQTLPGRSADHYRGTGLFKRDVSQRGDRCRLHRAGVVVSDGHSLPTTYTCAPLRQAWRTASAIIGASSSRSHSSTATRSAPANILLRSGIVPVQQGNHVSSHPGMLRIAGITEDSRTGLLPQAGGHDVAFLGHAGRADDGQCCRSRAVR